MTRTDAALAVRLVTTDGPSLLPLVLDDRLHAKWGRERVSSQDPGQRARGWSCSKEVRVAIGAGEGIQHDLVRTRAEVLRRRMRRHRFLDHLTQSQIRR